MLIFSFYPQPTKKCKRRLVPLKKENKLLREEK